MVCGMTSMWAFPEGADRSWQTAFFGFKSPEIRLPHMEKEGATYPSRCSRQWRLSTLPIPFLTEHFGLVPNHSAELAMMMSLDSCWRKSLAIFEINSKKLMP